MCVEDTFLQIQSRIMVVESFFLSDILCLICIHTENVLVFVYEATASLIYEEDIQYFYI